ncbi:hypothetical protein GH714_021823 [Hevea brasiliensis]|uniref:Uncharacterized protein n=1 Tax=Hevea brasiliensis TaxID=3981 RepID=A0A6A6LZD0_HEVBR|nr:hypothetical protein GH714_021823 [Hevea brasiliensis]
MERQQDQQPEPEPEPNIPDEKLSLEPECFEPKTLTKKQLERARAAAATVQALMERNAEMTGVASPHGYAGTKGREGGSDVKLSA